MNLSPQGPSWWQWVVRMIVTHEKRITRLEEQSDTGDSVTGFWSWVNAATSGPQKLVATATLLIIVVILVLILAMNDIQIPYVSGEVPVFAVTGEGARLLAKLVGSDHVHEADRCKAEEHDHEGAGKLPG